MSLRWLLGAFFAGIVLDQTPNSAVSGTTPVKLSAVAEAPLPDDPFEPVAGEVQAVDTPEARAQALQLLARARYLSNVRAYAYDLKTTFTSAGDAPYDGTWQLEDTSPGRNL